MIRFGEDVCGQSRSLAADRTILNEWSARPEVIQMGTKRISTDKRATGVGQTGCKGTGGER
jgi:hypothetical protein